MATITATVEDVTGDPDNYSWVFSAPLREGSGDGSIISPRPCTVTPVAGSLSVELDPGQVDVSYRGQSWTITVIGDADLWDLIAESEGL